MNHSKIQAIKLIVRTLILIRRDSVSNASMATSIRTKTIQNVSNESQLGNENQREE
jgi:hypothetical protein